MINLKFSNGSMRMLEVLRMQVQDKKFVCEQKCLIITKQEQLFRKKKKKRMWDEIKFKHGISLRSVKIVTGKNTSLQAAHTYLLVFLMHMEKEQNRQAYSQQPKEEKASTFLGTRFLDGLGNHGWSGQNSKVTSFGHTIPPIFSGPLQLIKVP